MLPHDLLPSRAMLHGGVTKLPCPHLTARGEGWGGFSSFQVLRRTQPMDAYACTVARALWLAQLWFQHVCRRCSCRGLLAKDSSSKTRLVATCSCSLRHANSLENSFKTITPSGQRQSATVAGGSNNRRPEEQWPPWGRGPTSPTTSAATLAQTSPPQLAAQACHSPCSTGGGGGPAWGRPG